MMFTYICVTLMIIIAIVRYKSSWNKFYNDI